MMHPAHPETALWRDAEAAPPAIGERRYIDVPACNLGRYLAEQAAQGWRVKTALRRVLVCDGAQFKRVALTLEYHGEAAE